MLISKIVDELCAITKLSHGCNADKVTNFMDMFGRVLKIKKMFHYDLKKLPFDVNSIRHVNSKHILKQGSGDIVSDNLREHCIISLHKMNKHVLKFNKRRYVLLLQDVSHEYKSTNYLTKVE